jgi:hypothetical protein
VLFRSSISKASDKYLNPFRSSNKLFAPKKITFLSTGIPTFWVRTSHNGSECGVVSDGISRDFKFKNDDKGQTYDSEKKNPVVGMFYEQYGDDLSDYHGYYVDCG